MKKKIIYKIGCIKFKMNDSITFGELRKNKIDHEKGSGQLMFRINDYVHLIFVILMKQSSCERRYFSTADIVTIKGSGRCCYKRS
jgi:hypothetical protein